MPKQTIEGVDVSSKRVLVRVDYNVPIQDGSIADDRRISASIPTIKGVLDRGGSCVLMSHMGRPEGAGYEEHLSLKPCAERLSELLGLEVAFPSNDCVDADAANAVESLGPGQALLLENLRFHKGEKKGDPDFAAKLAAYGDIYCNDAFGTCHRAEASMVAVPKSMSGKPRVIGMCVKKELDYLGATLEEPQRPYVVILGGAKVADKIPVIERILPKADDVLIGGAMAYTFLHALGHPVGSSRVEEESLELVQKILHEAVKHKVDLHLPVDHICSTSFSEKAGDIEVFEESIKDGFMGLDIGPKTQTDFVMAIRKAKTVVWNGPMGVFEWSSFKVGTQQVAKALVHATKEHGATTIVGGGDTAAAADQFGVADDVSHVSTGGGASLDMLAGEPFESVDLLDDA